MRFLLATLILAACSGPMEDDDDSVDGGIDDALDSGSDAGVDGGHDALFDLGNEFDDPATIAGWRTRNPDLGTIEVVDGRLIVTASMSAQWHNERESFFAAIGSIEGDFVMRAHLAAKLIQDPSMPPFLQFNAIGLLARDPGGDSNPERWAMNNVGFQVNTIGTRAAFTYDDETIQEIRATTDAELDLVLCRIGDEFRMFYLTLEFPDIWTWSGGFSRSTFPSSLEVGIAFDALGEQPHLQGEVDWIRFAVPSSWDDCTADIAAGS